MYNSRQLQRVASGPIANTPAGTSRSFSTLAASNAATGRKIGGARRVRLDDLSEGEASVRPIATSMGAISLEEKENQRAGRALRPARTMSKHVGYDKIPEVREDGHSFGSPTVIPHVAPRPRRSASLSDAPPPIDPLPERPPAHARPGTALGARRVTMEEKIRQEREIALEEGYATARREAEEAAGALNPCI